MIAFVTGGTGFVGAYLLHYLLAEGRYTTIRATRRATSRMDLVADITDKIEWHEADINDVFALSDAMQGCDEVYHCAAFVSFDDRDRAEMFKINIEGTANVVNIALQQGIKKLGHISSIAALGRNNKSNIYSEANTWQADPLNSNYAISKFYAEQEVWRGAAEGLAVVVVNPSIIVGSGYWNGGSCALFRQVAKGLPFYPLGSTGFVDVRDVAKAICALMASDISGERYILNGVNWSYRQFFDELADELGAKRPVVAVIPLLRELAWRVEWLRARILGKKSIITRETALTSAYDFEYRTDKFAAAMPHYTFFDMEQTIADTSAIYRAEKLRLLDII